MGGYGGVGERERERERAGKGGGGGGREGGKKRGCRMVYCCPSSDRQTAPSSTFLSLLLFL